MTEEQLREIEARAEAATPGPWAVVTHQDAGDWAFVGMAAVIDGNHRFWDRDSKSLTKADAAFIAAARTDVPALVAAYRELRALATELAEAMDRVVCCSTDWPQSAAALAKAREHGLVEAQG